MQPKAAEPLPGGCPDCKAPTVAMGKLDDNGTMGAEFACGLTLRVPPNHNVLLSKTEPPQAPRLAGPLRVLALDLASRTGYAVGGRDVNVILSGVWDIAPTRGESAGMRYIHLRAKLNEVLRAYPGLRFVVYEDPLMKWARGSNQKEYAIGCATRVQEWCAELGLDYKAVNPTHLKMHATGRGNAKKPDMTTAAVARGWKPVDDNEADALWLLDYALVKVL